MSEKSKKDASAFPGDPLFLDHLMKGDRGVLDAWQPTAEGGDMARPLIKKNKKNGDIYARPPDIETKIDIALGQDRSTLTRRAQISDRANPEHLPSECLVHLIRDSIRRGDHRVATMLMPLLLMRCEANLKRTVPDGELRDADATREEILSSLQLLFTANATEEELDYFECRFAHAFKTLRINHVRTEISRRKELTDLPEVINEDGETILDEDMLAHLSRMGRTGASQEDRVYLREVIAAVSKLPPDERSAVVLRRIFGYEVESSDPAKRTVAKICNVDGRTIRNRLQRADERLKKFKEEL